MMNDLKESMRQFTERWEKRQKEMMTVPKPWPPEESVLDRFVVCGLECAVVMGPVSINGYVHIPSGHPDNGKWYDDVSVDVHGGLTFMCRSQSGGTWYGFDTAHYGDMTILPFGVMDGQRWDVEDVRQETESLAEQLAQRGMST